MGEDLVVYGERPLTATEIRAQVNLIQEVMKSVMQRDQHYGVIPGAGNKPTLLKPGAEKIMATFRLAADPEVTDLSIDGVIRYRVKCRLLTPSAIFVGAGIGECSTDEEKYKWRAVVSEEEWHATDDTMKRIKFKKPYKDEPTQIKQIRTNPADIANTILKMAKKRALVDAVLTVTAASDIFTQDIEDLPGEYLQGQDRGQAAGKPPIQEPKKKEANGEGQPSGQKAGLLTAKISVKGVRIQTETKKGEKMKNPLYHIASESDTEYKTFDRKLADLAITEKGTGMIFNVEYEKDQYGNNLKSLINAEREPGLEG